MGTQIVILENGICGKSYDLRDVPFPRDLLSEEMVERKRELIWRIEEQEPGDLESTWIKKGGNDK